MRGFQGRASNGAIKGEKDIFFFLLDEPQNRAWHDSKSAKWRRWNRERSL